MDGFNLRVDVVTAVQLAPEPRGPVSTQISDLRFRGEFTTWSVNLTVRFNASVMSAEQVVNLFETSGFAVGIGDWRPERNGPFGRFHVAKGGE